MVAELRVPKREYYDWGEIGAARIDDGLVIFTGERPANAKENLDLTKLTFRAGGSIVIAVLVANLRIPIDAGEPIGIVQYELPEHMQEVAE